jgi:hypothetical protein
VRGDGDYLSARSPEATHELKQAIEAAASRSPMEFPKSGIAIPITGARDNGDLAAWVLPLDRGLRNELAAPFAASVAVFLRELGDTSPFQGELFVKRYGISPAECRVQQERPLTFPAFRNQSSRPIQAAAFRTILVWLHGPRHALRAPEY